MFDKWKGKINLDNLKINTIHFYPIMIFIVSLCGVYIFFFNNSFLYLFLDYKGIGFLSSILRLLKMMLICIIFYINYYAYSSYGKYRIKVFSMVFLIVAIFECIIFAKFINSNIFNQGAIYGLISNLVLAFGFLAGGLIPLDIKQKISEYKNREYYIVASITIICSLVISSDYVYKFIISSPGINFLEIIIEYIIIGVTSIAMVLYLKLYNEYENEYFLKFASSFIFFIFAQIFKLGYEYNSQTSVLMYNLYMIGGFFIFTKTLFLNNIKIPFNNIINAENQVKLYAENLEKIINKRTNEIRMVNNRLINELEYAKQIQQSLLPLKKLKFRNTTFVSEYFPCERLSGDFYDIYTIDDDNIGMYILDVSGHGISAALMTMFCNNYIKSTERLIKRYRGLKPHRNLRHFYEEFNKMNFPEEMHMVVFFSSYNMETKVLTYCSGGMNCYPILIKKNGDILYLSESSGFPICKMNDFYIPEYISTKINLEIGDRLIFYTDGLIDAYKNKIMDEEELIEILRRFSSKNLNDLNLQIKDKINPYSDNLEDDITYFIMEI